MVLTPATKPIVLAIAAAAARSESPLEHVRESIHAAHRREECLVQAARTVEDRCDQSHRCHAAAPTRRVQQAQ